MPVLNYPTFFRDIAWSLSEILGELKQLKFSGTIVHIDQYHYDVNLACQLDTCVVDENQRGGNVNRDFRICNSRAQLCGLH